ncbi:glutaredoxin family protein [Methyloceanibacter sp.]|uniref:glutaredoxin family protein n=1 Tax=Methyloceanibacter sp. TaxID=1965321 RepID=UPI0039C9D98D
MPPSRSRCPSSAPNRSERAVARASLCITRGGVPYCRQVRAILARNHISYRILDATTPKVQALMIRRFGDTAVPRTVIGGVLVEGVDEARILQLCHG